MRDGDGVDGKWTYPEVTVSGDTGVLAQILAEQRANSALLTEVVTRIAVLEQLMRDAATKDADKEARIRRIEHLATTHATTADLGHLEDTVDKMLPRADYESDRANRARWMTAVIAALVAIVVPLEAVVLSRLFG